jgi:O-succinylbenzoic acid--CoA ligase
MRLSFLAAAREVPDRPAVIAPAAAWSFAAFAPLAAGEVALLLREAAGASMVCLTAEASETFLARLYALLELGVPAVLLHPRWTPAERARAVAATSDAVDLDPVPPAPALDPSALPDLAPPAPSAPLAVVFTSGSSGAPRAVVLSRAAFAASADASAERLGWEADDRWLLSLPPAHVGGLSVVTRCLRARVPVVLGSGLESAALLARIRGEEVTLASFVPAQVRRLLDAAPEPAPPSLRAVLVGGGPCPTALLDEAEARGWPLLPTYGLTEACSQVATVAPGEGAAARGSAGRALPGVEVCISEGEILVRGPVLLDGYLDGGAVRRPLKADGWLATGDLGRLDDAGRLHVLGRRDELIVTGGENVAPQEVEEALQTCPGVREALVFGVPDASWGALVAAALVPLGEPPADGVLRRSLSARLAAFKRPRRIVWVDDLPRTPNGKPDRRVAASRLAAFLRPL